MEPKILGRSKPENFNEITHYFKINLKFKQNREPNDNKKIMNAGRLNHALH
jgi:hypothetical protein